MTATDAVQVAMRLIGALDPGETQSQSELDEGFARLNDMLANWALEKLNLNGTLINILALTSGQASYNLGPASSFTAVRPVKVIAGAVLQPAATGFIRVPLEMLTEQKWLKLPFRDSTFATNPTAMWFNPLFPVATLNFTPVPTFSGTRTIELETWNVIAAFPDEVTVVNFPPGYERAIRYNLAIELAAQYAATPTPQVIEIAAESKAALRMLNGSLPGEMPPTGPVNAIPQTS